MQSEEPPAKPNRQLGLLRGPRKGQKKRPPNPHPYNPNRLTLSRAEAADELGISVRTLTELIKDGRLTLRKINSARSARILRSDLLDFMQRMEVLK